jgi:hypothetical protein
VKAHLQSEKNAATKLSSVYPQLRTTQRQKINSKFNATPDPQINNQVQFGLENYLCVG